MFNKLNACYSSSLSGGINLISLIKLVTTVFRFVGTSITLKSLLSYLYQLKLIPDVKILQGNEVNCQSDSIIVTITISDSSP